MPRLYHHSSCNARITDRPRYLLADTNRDNLGLQRSDHEHFLEFRLQAIAHGTHRPIALLNGSRRSSIHLGLDDAKEQFVGKDVWNAHVCGKSEHPFYIFHGFLSMVDDHFFPWKKPQYCEMPSARTRVKKGAFRRPRH